MPLSGQVKQMFDAAADRLKNFYEGQRPYDPVDNPGGFRRGGNVVNYTPSLQDVAEVGSGISTLAVEVSQAANLVVDKTTAALAAADRAEGAASSAVNTLASKASIGITPVSNDSRICTPDDVLVSIQAINQPIAVFLPDADSYPYGQVLTVVDVSGDCSPEKYIQIYPGQGSGDTIAGADSNLIVIDQPYFAVKFVRGKFNLWVRV